MVGSGKKLYSGPKGREQVCGLGEGAASPHQLGRGLPVGSGAQPQPKLNLVHLLAEKSGIW